MEKWFPSYWRDRISPTARTSSVTEEAANHSMLPKWFPVARNIFVFLEGNFLIVGRGGFSSLRKRQKTTSTTITTYYGDVLFWTDACLQKKGDTFPDSWWEVVRNYLRLHSIPSYPALSPEDTQLHGTPTVWLSWKRVRVRVNAYVLWSPRYLLDQSEDPRALDAIHRDMML